MSNLFSDIRIGNYTVKNRIVLPPMVCFGWTDDRGIVSENHIKHYEEIAKGGAGLIILEAHAVTKSGRLADTQLGIWSDEHIEGLRKIAEACHKHGALVTVQIHHAGMKTPKTVIEQPLAPSDYNEARALTMDEIQAIQADFVAAAKRAKAAGLDGIELHGAHGYLISQFMSPIVNTRQDEYGGSIENRSRFAVEIIERIKNEVGEDFILGYRMGGNEPDLENGIAIAKILEKAGVQLLHVSAGIPSDTLPTVPENFPYHWIIYCGTEIKKQVQIPVIVVFGLRTPEQAAYIIENNMADFTAIGKAFLSDHEWANHAKDNVPVVTCMECKKCAWYTNGNNCPRYGK